MSEAVAVNPAATPAPAGEVGGEEPILDQHPLKAGRGVSKPAAAPQKAAPKNAEEAAKASIPAGKDPAEPKAEEPPAEKPKYKLKRGEKEEEYDESALLEALEIADQRKAHIAAANKRFQEAAEIQKRIEEARAKGPAEFLKAAFGANDEQIQQWMVGELQRVVSQQRQEGESEEAYRARIAEGQLAAYQQAEAAKRQAEIESKQQTEFQQRVRAFEEDFGRRVPALAEKYNLPADSEASRAETAREIGAAVAAQLRGGYAEPDYEAAAEFVAERHEEIVRRTLDRLSRKPGALLQKYPEIVKRLREEAVASVRSAPAQPGKPASAPSARPQAAQPQKPPTWRDEEAEFRARKFGFAR